jgi:hypothetical protein
MCMSRLLAASLIVMTTSSIMAMQKENYIKGTLHELIIQANDENEQTGVRNALRYYLYSKGLVNQAAIIEIPTMGRVWKLSKRWKKGVYLIDLRDGKLKTLEALLEKDNLPVFYVDFHHHARPTLTLLDISAFSVASGKKITPSLRPS